MRGRNAVGDGRRAQERSREPGERRRAHSRRGSSIECPALPEATSLWLYHTVVARPPFDPRRAAGGEPDLFTRLDDAPADGSSGSPRSISQTGPSAAAGSSPQAPGSLTPPPLTPSPPPPSPPGEPPRRRGEGDGESDSEPEPISVSELSGLVSSALARLPARLRVVGEVSNLRANKHLYFSLKDERAVVSCAMWASSMKSLRELPREGDLVAVTGSLEHYAPQGKTQIIVRRIEAVGLGPLEQQLRRRMTELRAIGYFDDARKKSLPRVPGRIAIITGAGSAALADCLRTARDRMPAVELLVVAVLVQGKGAAEEVARAIAALDAGARRLGIDAILVTRGGGSLEDLWAFNERIVADAVFACRTPLVAAIGHESDTSIIELVADRRASTPTQAITMLVPERQALREALRDAARRLRREVEGGIEDARRRLDLARRHEFLRRPEERVGDARRRIVEARGRLARSLASLVREARVHLEHRRGRLASATRARIPERAELSLRRRRLERALASGLERARARVAAGAGRLRSIGPAEVLARGYAILTDDAGRLLRSVEDARVGAGVSVAVGDGTVRARVESVRRGDPLEAPSEGSPAGG